MQKASTSAQEEVQEVTPRSVPAPGFDKTQPFRPFAKGEGFAFYDHAGRMTAGFRTPGEAAKAAEAARKKNPHGDNDPTVVEEKKSE